MIIGCDETRINKIIKKESNKKLLQECLSNERVSESIRKNDMQLLYDNLTDDYIKKDLLKIIPLLVMLFMSVKEKISADKLLARASEYMWNVPIYYMNIDVLDVTTSFIPKLIGCSIGKLTISIYYNYDEYKLSEIIKALNLKKCKIQKLDIIHPKDEEGYFDMSEDEIREYIKTVGGEVNSIE